MLLIKKEGLFSKKIWMEPQECGTTDASIVKTKIICGL